MTVFCKEEQMRGSVAVLVACLLLSGAVLAGCGGGGDKEGSTTTAAGGEVAAKGEGGEGAARSGSTEASESGGAAQTAKPQSKAEFVTAANALCTKWQRQAQTKLTALFKSASAEGSKQAAMQRIVEKAIAPTMEAEAEGLRALGAPQGEEEEVEAVAAAIEAVVDEARQDPTAFVTDANAFKSAEHAARAYGIGACGRVS